MKRLIYPTLLFTFIIILASCHKKEEEQQTPKKVCVSDTLAKMIKIDTAKSTNIDDVLNLSGEVSFNEDKVVKIFPFAGGQVVNVKVSLGDKVSKGQVLAVLRSADVAGNYNELSASQSDLAIAKRQMQQAESLYKNGISSERDYTEAKEAYNKALSSNNKIKNQININGGGNTSANGSYIIKAPISGYIVEKNINTGNFIRADNASSLFTISDMKEVWINANVFETDINRIKLGYPVQITTIAYPGRIFNGKIDKVSDILDPDNKVMKVRINLSNSDLALKPEMFTNVIVNNKQSDKATSVPSSAIIFDDGKNFVVLYHDQCHLEIKEVTVIKTVDNTAYISSGLKVGDRIISKNQVLLYNAILEEE